MLGGAAMSVKLLLCLLICVFGFCGYLLYIINKQKRLGAAVALFYAMQMEGLEEEEALAGCVTMLHPSELYKFQQMYAQIQITAKQRAFASQVCHTAFNGLYIK
jgi:hypothetical protein